MLSPERIKTFYDRFGSKQDSQGFYEDRPLELLAAHAALDGSRRVFEFGCGTGRLARRLLERSLPADALYLGCDVSTTMVRLAGPRLLPLQPRALVVQVGGGTSLPIASTSVDRFLSTYVIDLLSEPAARDLLLEAGRILVPGGKLCLVGITRGRGLLSTLLMQAWALLYRMAPAAVGGCRPVELLPMLDPAAWHIDHHEVVAPLGIASEILVASRHAQTPVGALGRTGPARRERERIASRP